MANWTGGFRQIPLWLILLNVVGIIALVYFTTLVLRSGVFLEGAACAAVQSGCDGPGAQGTSPDAWIPVVINTVAVAIIALTALIDASWIATKIWRRRRATI